MFRLCIPLLLIATGVRSDRLHTSALFGLVNPSSTVECTDNVCKVVPSSSSIKTEIIDLENKILKEWKAAAGPAEPTTNTSTSVVDEIITPSEPEPVIVETSDVDQKVSELEKMGFSPEDAKLALKKADFEVSAAAAILEADEEENEEIRKKVAEIGEEISTVYLLRSACSNSHGVTVFLMLCYMMLCYVM